MYLAGFELIQRLAKHDMRNNIRSHPNPPLPNINHLAIISHTLHRRTNLLSGHHLPLAAQRTNTKSPPKQLPPLRVISHIRHLEKTIRRTSSFSWPKEVVEVRLDEAAANLVDLLVGRDVGDEDLVGPGAYKGTVLFVEGVVVLDLAMGHGRQSAWEVGELGVPWSWNVAEGVEEGAVEVEGKEEDGAAEEEGCPVYGDCIYG